MNTAHMTSDVRDVALLVGELNDLLQLDYDAVATYTLALEALADAGSRDAVRKFKADHERHIEELTALVRFYGGVPMPSPHLAGVAVQGGLAGGSDAAVIQAFKANETQSRDKYRRAASRQHPADVQDVLIRGARDEQRHFDWAMRTLSELGVSTDGVADALESMHARSDDARSSVHSLGPLGLVVAGAVLVGAAALVTTALRRR